MNETIDLSYYNSLPDICSFCQRSFTLENPRTLDHIRPFCTYNAKNRSKTPSLKQVCNLLICCRECNCLKADFTIEQFKDKLKNERFKLSKTKSILIPKERRLIMLNSIQVLLTNSQK